MIDSSFLLRNFVYQKIIRVCNELFYCSSKCIMCFIRRYHKADAFMIIAINHIIQKGGGAEQVMLKNLKISFLDIIFRHILEKYTLLLLLLYTKLMTKHHRNSFAVTAEGLSTIGIFSLRFNTCFFTLCCSKVD